METIFDVQQILKRFGTFIYTGDRLGDLDLMEFEINELYKSSFILVQEFQMAKLVLRKEVRRIRKERE